MFKLKDRSLIEMKKDRIVKLCVAVIFVSVLVVGGSIAFFRAETNATSPMSSTNLGIELMEGKTEEGTQTLSDGTVVLDNVSPGATIDKQLYVENVKESPSYIRVTLTKYWEDADGVKLPEKAAEQIIVDPLDETNWIVQRDKANDEVIYMYYKAPIETGEVTTNFLNQVKIAQSGADLDNSYTNLKAKVDVEVDAIQQYAAQDAILAEWGLEVAFDQNGMITQVEE